MRSHLLAHIKDKENSSFILKMYIKVTNIEGQNIKRQYMTCSPHIFTYYLTSLPIMHIKSNVPIII